jgi:hypothetical protein
MIKFQLFDTEKSYQCHFAEISTFVVSIAHYMRAYFNYQALEQGKNFELPEDAAFLNVSNGFGDVLRCDFLNSFLAALDAVHFSCVFIYNHSVNPVPKHGAKREWYFSVWQNWLHGTRNLHIN